MNKMLRSARGVLMILPVVVIAPVAGFASPHDAAKAMYLRYCGACHGQSGKGDGVVSGFLRPRPTDLTQIAKKAGGEYSSAQVVQMIDGTKTVRAHGDADMPVWGEVFRERSTTPMSQRVEIQGKLLLIAEYLRSIQEN
jgi:mono/diheme cytochrome c family protein